MERIGEIIHIDQSFGGHELYSAKVLGITKQHIGSADLMIYVTGIATGLAGIAGCLSCVCDKEIGDDPSSRQWNVYKPKYWARHNANVYQSTVAALAGVSTYFNDYEFFVHIINCYYIHIHIQFKTLAHEIGHNIGLWHDHSSWHKKVGCNGKGMMSYGNHPISWSECSVNDFKAYYNHATKVQKLPWCMEGENYLKKKTITILGCTSILSQNV